jgi:hypothetical protein
MQRRGQHDRRLREVRRHLKRASGCQHPEPAVTITLTVAFGANFATPVVPGCPCCRIARAKHDVCSVRRTGRSAIEAALFRRYGAKNRRMLVGCGGVLADLSSELTHIDWKRSQVRETADLSAQGHKNCTASAPNPVRWRAIQRDPRGKVDRDASGWTPAGPARTFSVTFAARGADTVDSGKYATAQRAHGLLRQRHLCGS